ncbi:MAG TPA: hypothetical protein VF658_03930 [Pyrinomonadaceae bacterium]|jgi:hypothetical protein
MKFDINTLKRATCAVIAACVLLLGTWTSAQAQRRSRGAVNGYPDNAYGQQRRAQNRYWRDRRRNLQRHQRYERSTLRDRWRRDRDDYDNTRDWRARRKSERRALRVHQKTERREFKQTFKNRRKGF